jgi:hypothetical protein
MAPLSGAVRGAGRRGRAPSAVVPQVNNVLLNPLHPAATAATVVNSDPFRFDPRLWRVA